MTALVVAVTALIVSAWPCRARFIPFATNHPVRCERHRFHRGKHRAHVVGALKLTAFDRTVDMSGWDIHLTEAMIVGGSNVTFTGGNFNGNGFTLTSASPSRTTEKKT